MKASRLPYIFLTAALATPALAAPLPIERIGNRSTYIFDGEEPKPLNDGRGKVTIDATKLGLWDYTMNNRTAIVLEGTPHDRNRICPVIDLKNTHLEVARHPGAGNRRVLDITVDLTSEQRDQIVQAKCLISPWLPWSIIRRFQ